jgi:hypothetical protein
MSPIPVKDAVERLAKVVEKASSDDLVQFYNELHPANRLPAVNGMKAKQLAKELSAQIRAGIEPEEIVDLWHVVFPTVHVRYEEEHDVLRHIERQSSYAEQ